MKQVRTEQRSLSAAEYAALPPEAQAEYSRMVRDAMPHLYSMAHWREVLAQMQANEERGRQMDEQADHYEYIANKERRVGRKP